MDPALATDSGSDQTMPFIAGWQCVEAAGAGAGASDNGKQMIVGGIAWVFDVGAYLSTVIQLFVSDT